MKFRIGDIVRVVLSSTSMSTHKRHLINETGIVVKEELVHTIFDAEKQAYIVQFFHTAERVMFFSDHLIKEEDWIIRQKRSI